MRRMETNLDPYSEKLARFKEDEKPEAVLLVADDPQMEKIVVAWTSMTVARVENLGPLDSASENEVWNWLWRNTIYSRDELLARSTVHDFAFGKKLDALIGNRILYPDGTINSYVQRYLREKVLKLFDAKPKKSGKRGG
jgi:hypothetical protein